MSQPFPAIILPLHRSLAGYKIAAWSRGSQIFVVDDAAHDAHEEFFHRARTYAHVHQDQYLMVRGDEAMVWNQERAIEATPAGRQHVLPGAERDAGGAIAKKRSAEPMRPRKPQAACDIGLFDMAARDQASLL